MQCWRCGWGRSGSRSGCWGRCEKQIAAKTPTGSVSKVCLANIVRVSGTGIRFPRTKASNLSGKIVARHGNPGIADPYGCGIRGVPVVKEAVVDRRTAIIRNGSVDYCGRRANRSCHRCLHGGRANRGSWRGCGCKRRNQVRAIWRTQSGTKVVTGDGRKLERADWPFVIAGGSVVEIGGVVRSLADRVKSGIQKADRLLTVGRCLLIN
jgi:hypothetical protein